MRTNPVFIKNYANYMDTKSILKTKKFKIAKLSQLTCDKEMLKINSKMNEIFGKVIGIIKLQERKSGNFIQANIRKFRDYGEYYTLEYNNESLCKFNFGIYDPNSNPKGIELASILKEPEADNLKEVAKAVDIFAVKKSEAQGLKGFVYLLTGEGDSQETFSLAEPIHWSRGYVDVDYLGRLDKYNKKMRKQFKEYKKARKEGYSIEEAKQKIGINYADSVRMVLLKSKVKEYLKNTNLMELF